MVLPRLLVFPAAIAIEFNHSRLVKLFFVPVITSSLFLLTIPRNLRSVTLFVIGFYAIEPTKSDLPCSCFGDGSLFRIPSPLYTHWYSRRQLDFFYSQTLPHQRTCPTKPTLRFRSDLFSGFSSSSWASNMFQRNSWRTQSAHNQLSSCLSQNLHRLP